jgi:hypothetical protein
MFCGFGDGDDLLRVVEALSGVLCACMLANPIEKAMYCSELLGNCYC